MRLEVLNITLKMHFLCINTCRIGKNAYLCIVFFMVLDLF